MSFLRIFQNGIFFQYQYYKTIKIVISNVLMIVGKETPVEKLARKSGKGM
jgi:hypothetical protein